jgi:hypothetical protein
MNTFLSGLILALLVAGIAAGLSYMSLTREPPRIQGFYGGAAGGTGSIRCEKVSKEAAELSALFSGRAGSTEEAEPDLREFRILLGQLACFKKDLVSPSGIVEATRKSEFRTSLNLEPLGETTARCYAKTIPPRDLELVFEKWSKRGDLLLRRLCASYDLKSAEIDRAERVLRALIADVADIARGACLKGKVEIAGTPGPRDARPRVPGDVFDLGPYDGYY